MKTVLCGPPHSGKSCLREGLKQAILPFHRAGIAPYPYFITACPDGEGAWYAEAVRNNPDLADKLKQEYKAKFTWAFAENKALDVKNVSLPLTVIDVGGKIDDKNELIMQYATHAVILAGEMSKVAEWEVFCQKLNLSIIAIIHSDYEGKCDRIETETPILRGSVHYLERGEDVSTRPIVQALARVLIDMCGK
ncbi:hypothetical protein [Floridanema aerugineum]|uniref:CRISPR-associated protein Csx3 n=1 Tax=Floridaenema aerugineum BLCC-F46 TaxID=3153654 RepID=A0ABV4XIU3_9CYAN